MMSAPIPDWQAKAAMLKASGLIDEAWYKNQYPDVEMLGMDASEHYLKYGAAMGRNPSEAFNTRFYLETYPEIAQTDQNPLLHYILHGREEGRYGCNDDRRDPLRRIKEASRRLRVLGFTNGPIEDLQTLIAETDDPVAQALAQTEIALWHFQKGTSEGYATSLAYLQQAISGAIEDTHQSRLILLRLLCHYHLKQVDQARALFDEAAILGLDTPEVCLARANFETTPENRLTFINRALSKTDIPPVTLKSGASAPYNRLTMEASPVKVPVEGHPKISVLIAAYNAAKTLPAALRSLQEQSWQNLEIIIIDDASTDETTSVASRFANDDRRIKLLHLKENGGAYVARNAGLDMATGKYVTLHDADDWSHPLKLEIQVRCLEAEPALIGCTSQQVRASDKLEFTRCTDDGRLIFPNTSSLMFQRKAVQETCGYWDNVRFSADSELIRRIRKMFGHQAIRVMETGSLSFQRHSNSSIVAHPVFGINGSPYGIRHEYFEAQHYHHKHATSLRYDRFPTYRPFPAPNAMQVRDQAILHFDIVLVSDFRLDDQAQKTALQIIPTLKAAGLKIGLVQLYTYAADPNPHCHIQDSIRSLTDGAQIHFINYGEKAHCDKLIVLNTDVLADLQKFLPCIEPDTVEIISRSSIDRSNVQSWQMKNALHYFQKHAVQTKDISFDAYIDERLRKRKERLASIFRPDIQKTVFYRKLHGELLPALNDQVMHALHHSEMALQRLVLLSEGRLISIIMPTYNRAHIIADAIQSVRDQSYTDWELLVCDDGSTDNTSEIIKRFNDPRIHYLRIEKSGAAAARNTGLNKASGTLITYLDSDNYWHPHYLSYINDKLPKAEINKEAPTTVYTNYIDYNIDENGFSSIESWRRPDFDYEKLLKKNYIDLNTFAHRRELYELFGGFNPALKRRQDYDLILKYTWLQNPIHGHEILALYQRNAQLTQITQSQGGDTSCVDIINLAVDSYSKSGLPIQNTHSDLLANAKDNSDIQQDIRTITRNQMGLNSEDTVLACFPADYREYLEEEILKDKTYILPTTDIDMSTLIPAADALILWEDKRHSKPLHECIIALHALKSGIPIVTNATQMPAAWTAQGNIHHFDENDPEAILMILDAIFANKSKYYEKQKNSKRLYNRQHSEISMNHKKILFSRIINNSYPRIQSQNEYD